MPKCVPMTRSSELRPLTLLLYVVPVTLMELLRRWGSGTTSGSGGGGGGGGGGGTGTHTHVFAMQECKGLQHLGWLHFTELAILFKIPKNDPWLSSGHTSLQILSHPGHSSPKSLKRSRLTSLSCLEMFKKLLRFLNQKMVSPTNWKNWETVSEEVVIMHRNMSQAMSHCYQRLRMKPQWVAYRFSAFLSYDLLRSPDTRCEWGLSCLRWNLKNAL